MCSRTVTISKASIREVDCKWFTKITLKIQLFHFIRLGIYSGCCKIGGNDGTIGCDRGPGGKLSITRFVIN